jgi:hypothetical protein
MAKEKITKIDNSKKGTERVSTTLHKAAMIVRLKESLGVITAACDLAGITRQTHYTWMSEDAEYAKAVTEMEDIALDFAESALHRQIRADVPASTIFYLKTKGKRRGYVERTEHIVETTDSLANRIDFDQAKRLLDSAGIATQVKDDALTSDE